MIRAFLLSAAVLPVLRSAAVLLVATSVSRAAMGFCFGYMLFAAPGVLGELGLMIAYGGLLTASTLSRDRMELLLAGLTEDFSSAQQKRVIQHVIRADATDVEAFGPGKIVAQIEQFMRAIAMFDRMFGGLIAFVATLGSVLLMALIRNPMGFLVALGVIKVAAIIYFVNRRLLGARATELARINREYRDGVADLTLGFKELKLNPARAAWLLKDRLRPISRRLGRVRGAYETTAGLNQTFAEIVALLAAGAVAAGAAAVVPGDGVSTGIIAISIIGLPTFALRALPDFMQLRNMIAEIDTTLAALPAEPRPVSAEAAIPITEFTELRLAEAVFRPDPARRFVLGPINCEFRAGTISFLIGGNGSGKSTLMRLLCGLTAPHSGDVLLNGEPVWLPAQRQLFSTVFAEVHLFDRLYGMPAGAEAEVNQWLAELGIADVTHVVDGRFTRLGLSTGQRKRVALAVALAEHRPVLLLDEWAADQDPESRRYFYTVLLPRLRAEGRTIIAISHDDRYFDIADRLFRLEDGQLSELHPRAERIGA